MSNRGVDAFKHDDYGEKIIIERRISESGNTTTLKDSRGKFSFLIKHTNKFSLMRYFEESYYVVECFKLY